MEGGATSNVDGVEIIACKFVEAGRKAIHKTWKRFRTQTLFYS